VIFKTKERVTGKAIEVIQKETGPKNVNELKFKKKERNQKFGGVENK